MGVALGGAQPTHALLALRHSRVAAFLAPDVTLAILLPNLVGCANCAPLCKQLSLSEVGGAGVGGRGVCSLCPKQVPKGSLRWAVLLSSFCSWSEVIVLRI